MDTTAAELRVSRRRALAFAGGGLAVGALLATTSHQNAIAQEPSASPVAAGLDWDQVDQLLALGAPETTLLTAELVDGRVETIHGLNADVSFPVGSSFKLWILGALALKIQAGELAWEQVTEIKDEYRSVPGGDLRYALAGTQLTIRYLAERMMQKSDNTATDHLFYIVGRENVEAAMIAMGHSDPAANIPIISTRELALLKFAYSSDYLDEFYAKTPDQRRAVLNDEIDQQSVDEIPDLDQTAPIEIDRVEWFATRHDLAATMSWLLAKYAEDGMLPIREVISLETQLPFDGEVWPYVGFKGGSELGVLSGTWLMQRADGREFVFSVGLKNPTGPIDMAAAATAMQAAIANLVLVP